MPGPGISSDLGFVVDWNHGERVEGETITSRSTAEFDARILVFEEELYDPSCTFGYPCQSRRGTSLEDFKSGTPFSPASFLNSVVLVAFHLRALDLRSESSSAKPWPGVLVFYARGEEALDAIARQLRPRVQSSGESRRSIGRCTERM
jgi:hypothetical protein